MKPTRRRSKPPANRRKRRPGRLPLALAALLALLLVMLVVGAPRLADSYLASDRSRPPAERALGRQLGMDVELAPFRDRDGQLYSASLTATGDGLSLQARDLEARAWLDGWPGGTLRIDSFSIREATLEADNRPRAPEPAAAGSHSEPALPSWLAFLLPRDFELAPVVIQRASVDAAASGNLRLDRLTLDPAAGSLRLHAGSGSLQSHRLGDWLVTEFEALLGRGDLRIVALTMQAGDSQAGVEVSGRLGRERGGELRIACAKLPLDRLAPSLADNARGLVDGRARASRDSMAEAWRLEGEFQIEDGRIERLAVLDLLATYTGDDSLRSLPLHRASGRFTRSRSELALEAVEIESRPRLKLRGNLRIAADNRLDGQFQLGISAHLARALPVDHEAVFEQRADGYLWTPLAITGTTSNPRENLTARLLAAMPAGMVRKTGQALRATGRALGGDAESTAAQAADIIEDAGSRFFDLLPAPER